MSLKNIFIKDAEPEQPAPVTGTEQPIDTSRIAAAADVRDTETNETVVQSLWQVLIDKNLPGPDYLEVKNTAAALGAMNLPVDKCYEAAFRSVQAANPGFTKSALIESIDKYISIIEQERSDGKRECAAKRQTLVGEKETRLKQLGEHKADLERQVEELREQIKSTHDSIVKLSTEIEKSEADINREEALFGNSVDFVVDSLNKDREIMNKMTI